MQDESVNIDISASLIPLQTASAGELPQAPFTPPSGATFVSTISGQSGNVILSGGTTGLTFTGGGGIVTVAGLLAAANGGTGIASYSVGDLLYASAAATLSKLADVAVGSYLRSGGVNTAPLWSTTTLPNAATTGDLLYASAANVYSNLADIATGNALISGGVGAAPSWGKIGLTTHVTGVLPVANGGVDQTAWQSWTPSWTNVTVGNGTVTAKYQQIGKTVFARLDLIFGTTTSVSGEIIFSLPVNSVSYVTASRTNIGAGTAVDTGTAAYEMTLKWQSTTTVLCRPMDVATYVRNIGASATVPFTWGNTDELHVQFFYEAA